MISWLWCFIVGFEAEFMTGVCYGMKLIYGKELESFKDIS